MNYRAGPRQKSPPDRLSSIAAMNSTRSCPRSTSYKLFCVVSIFFFFQQIGALGIIDRSVYGDRIGMAGGTKITQTIKLLSIFTCLFLFWAGTRKIKIARFNRVLPVAAASVLLVSVVWSVDPGLTFREGALYFFVVLGTIGLVETFDADVLMDLTTLTCGLSAAASVVQFFMFHEPGDFRGIFGQKNVLGQVMVGGVLGALHGARRGGQSFRYIVVIGLCTVVAFMSKSSTSIFAILTLLVFDMLGRLYLKGSAARVVSIFLLLLSIPITIFFVLNEDLMLDFLGKDRSLTGRTLIWPYVIDRIVERPILGWGFAAFWSTSNPVALQIAEALRGESWVTLAIPNAHNTMLELPLQIGFVGAAFFLYLWFRNLVLAVKCLNGPAPQFGVSSVLLLIAIFLVGLSEEVLLAAGQLWTALFFMIGFSCEKQLWLARDCFVTHKVQRSMPGANAAIKR
jgi:exopolysaccharide production protein ExoQ